MKNFDLISIGDASIDVFMMPTETETLCRLDTKECFIAFSYGQKIPVKNLDFSIGGNAANNAVGTRRLGINTAIVLTLGQDSVAEMIIKSLKDEGVDATYVVQQPATSSNYSTIINYQGERTIFTYHAPRVYELPQNLIQTPWLYLTSMGEGYRPFYDQVIKWLSDKTKLAFNPGSWQLKNGLESIHDIVARTFVLFVNREEAQILTNSKETQGKEKELLKALFDLGVEIPVVTDGNNGAFAFDGEKYLKVGVLPIDAYERTGAGDAFGSGFLASYIKDNDLNKALLSGTVNSASVIGYTGSQRGLLRETEISQWLERAKSSEVNVVEF